MVYLTLSGVVAVAALTSPLWGFELGRRIDWLEVDRVEVSGTVLLAPHEVLAASGLRSGHHLLDEREPLVLALRGHPVIADAAVTRRPPNTLRIRVQEERAVALVDDGMLRPATGAGEILPVDPAAVPVDLPIVRGTLRDSASTAAVRVVLAEIERLALLDPVLVTEISELRLLPGEPGVLAITHRNADLLLPVGATGERLAELHAVLEHVATSNGAALQGAAHELGTPDGSAPTRIRLDLRFADQIVVAPSPLPENL